MRAPRLGGLVATFFVLAACTATPPAPTATPADQPIATPSPTPSATSSLPTPATPSPSPAPAVPPSPTPVASAELRVVVDGGLPVDLLSPWFTNQNRGALLLSHLLYDRLYALDNRLLPFPQAALALPDYSADGTWTVSLRPGLRFHDGAPVTADDVVLSVALHQCREGGCIGPLVDLHAADERTVVFELDDAPAPFLIRVLADVPILPAAAIRRALDELLASAGGVDAAALAGVFERVEDHDETLTAVELAEFLTDAGVALPPASVFRHGSDHHWALMDRLRALHTLVFRNDLSELMRIHTGMLLLGLATAPIGSGPFRFEERDEGLNRSGGQRRLLERPAEHPESSAPSAEL